MRIRSREERLDGNSDMLRGTHGRGEFGGLLELESPWCDPFRQMLVHPKIVPYLNEILGKGFRMDHQMFLISMDKGAEGFIFHGFVVISGLHFATFFETARIQKNMFFLMKNKLVCI